MEKLYPIKDQDLQAALDSGIISRENASEQQYNRDFHDAQQNLVL